MKIYVKYLILIVAFGATFVSAERENVSCGFAAAGAFIAFAMLEINDLKIINSEEELK